MPSKKKNTGSIDWDATNAKVKEFDRLHFTIGGIDVSKYYNPTNTVTVLDEYYGKLSLFFAEISKLFVTLENAIYREGNVGRNSLAEIQSILHQSVNSNNDHFKTTLGVETDVFQCRFIQKTVSEINNKNYLAKYLDEIISYEPNQLYDYNQGLLHSIKTIADIFTIPQKLFEYISPKFEHLIVGHIPFFDDLKLIQECPQILGTEKIINKLEEINKTIISTGTFAKVPTQPKETMQGLPVNLAQMPKRLKWLGTSAQFGFIFQELIGKGYLEKPTSSYSKDADIYLSMFDIEGTKGTLTKEISTGENQNSLSATNRAKIKIPLKDQLK